MTVGLVIVLGLADVVLGPTDGLNNADGAVGLMNVRVDGRPAALPDPTGPPAAEETLLELDRSGEPAGGNNAELDDGNNVDDVLDVDGELSVDGELNVDGELSVVPPVGPAGATADEVALDVPGVGTQFTPGVVCANDAIGAADSAHAHTKPMPYFRGIFGTFISNTLLSRVCRSTSN